MNDSQKYRCFCTYISYVFHLHTLEIEMCTRLDFWDTHYTSLCQLRHSMCPPHDCTRCSSSDDFTIASCITVYEYMYRVYLYAGEQQSSRERASHVSERSHAQLWSSLEKNWTVHIPSSDCSLTHCNLPCHIRTYIHTQVCACLWKYYVYVCKISGEWILEYIFQHQVSSMHKFKLRNLWNMQLKFTYSNCSMYAQFRWYNADECVLNNTYIHKKYLMYQCWIQVM